MRSGNIFASKAPMWRREDVRDVATVEGVGYFAEDGDVLVGGGEVAHAEKVDRLVVDVCATQRAYGSFQR